MKSSLLGAALATLLLGCGQKGPLYLPDQTGEVVTRPAQTPPQQPPPTEESPPEEEDDEEEKPPQT